MVDTTPSVPGSQGPTKPTRAAESARQAEPTQQAESVQQAMPAQQAKPARQTKPTQQAEQPKQAKPPKTPRDRHRLPAPLRRQQILDATCELIAERGFWGLSMQDVADRCGLTVPGLLHYVGSKTGLLVAVLEHRDVDDAKSLRSRLAVGVQEVPDDWSAGGPEGVDLRQLCSATMRRNAEQPEIVRLFAVLEVESLNPGHPAHEYFAARQRRVVESFAALAGGLTDQPERLARRIVALMDGLQMQWLREPATIDLVQEWESAAEVLFGRPGPEARAAETSGPE